MSYHKNVIYIIYCNIRNIRPPPPPPQEISFKSDELKQCFTKFGGAERFEKVLTADEELILEKDLSSDDRYQLVLKIFKPFLDWQKERVVEYGEKVGYN